MNIQQDPYKALAERLDNLPNGFPPTDDGAELRLLAKIFKPEEAELASHLLIRLETAEQMCQRLERDYTTTRSLLKSMASRGLIRAGKTEGGLGYGLLPFVVGIYENQVGDLMDAELARLFEDYYQRSFTKVLTMQPSVHRVVPVNENIKMDMEVAPYESVAGIIEHAQSWGVFDCICRKQKALIGDPCKHPIEMCMIFNNQPDAYVNASEVRALTKAEAYELVHQAELAGLVHTVSNSQKGTWYICNCCTCSCGILRGMSELGIANVVARSAFVNTVDEDLCNACGLCLESCQFNALSLAEVMVVDRVRCVGCGVCVSACPDHALVLVRRPEEEIKPVPTNIIDWGLQRAQERGLDLSSLI
jgi:ferredoxin